MKKPDSSELAIVADRDPALRLAPRLLPDALAFAASLVIVWQALRTGDVDERSMSWVTSVLAGELFTFFFVVALVEVASRRRQPPTLWVGFLIIAALLVFCPTVLMLAKWSWHGGVWVFLPFLWSMVERLRQLWTLPRASLLEKLRTRALAFDRFQTGLSGYFVMFLVLVASLMVSDDPDFPYRAAELVIPGFLALFFAIACIDEIRVHGEGFARSPRRLWAKPGRPDPTLTEMKPI
ncbi:MAG TPA: hypothetical protein VGX68_23780 [Thermoanaerobaculia bacterium]|jgi:hypothetical protein|nr:hypothetical protein [Thermoanaerobaculia bacterium]